MALRAGFAEVDITPPVGSHKIGWLRDIVAEEIHDPLHASVAVLESGGQWLAFVVLDTLSVRWSTTEAIRAAATRECGLPGACIMVSATHNHAGPAVANCGAVARDEAYLADLQAKVVAGLGQALSAMTDAALGVGRCCECEVAHNRRVVQRDGTTKTHGTFADPGALCSEGPIDPELGVLAFRSAAGAPLGALVSFTCHPTHVGGDPVFSAGYPGRLGDAMRAAGWPVTVYLNGAMGNVHHSNPADGGRGLDQDALGRKLAADALGVIAAQEHWRREVRLRSSRRRVDLPYRQITDAEVAGTVFGAQRFVDPTVYDAGMPSLCERIRTRGVQPAEVQVQSLDEVSIVGIPAEYFVECGLRIKEESWPRRALIAGMTNGMVGYVPHRDAFRRGGYETTFAHTSRLAPEAGDLLADCAIELVRLEEAQA